MEVKCPRCGKPSVFAPENPFRPFCSERCKLVDLGHWADGTYAIPVKPAELTEEEIESVEELFAGESDPEADLDGDRSSENDPRNHIRH